MLEWFKNLVLGRPVAGTSDLSSRPHAETAGGETAGALHVELLVVDSALDEDQAREWCARQTCPGLVVVGLDRDGRERWRTNSSSASASEFFVTSEGLPVLDPSHIEGALLIACAENLDGVVLTERVESLSASPARDFEDILDKRFQPFALWSRSAFALDVPTGLVRLRTDRAAGDSALIKFIPYGGVTRSIETEKQAVVSGFGQYFSPDSAPTFAYRDASARFPKRNRRAGEKRPGVLVTTPFLATGGAERTLYETLKVLSTEFEFTIVTLAPHQQELGDRRQDFQALTPDVLSFGDWVHPDAMLEMLLAVIDSRDIDILYNANGTTLFYQFAPLLKAARPGLRILDHLYDHRVGYIESYSSKLLPAIDLCVAENHRIRDTLLANYGWRKSQVEVIWPCGRSFDSFPKQEERAAVREKARRILGAEDESTLVLLVAARMHDQKRPLDLVDLAARLKELPVRIVLVGGGALEDAVDKAIEDQGLSNIVRLDFRDDIPELIVGADVGCLVSEYEGLPVFMLECFQVGRPFLGTAVGEMGSVLEASGAGVVVERPGDLDALEEAVRSLCDPVTRKALADRAAEIAPEFSVERCAKRYGSAFLGEPVETQALSPR